MYAFEIEHLSKSYGRRMTVLRNLSLRVVTGESYALLGAQGAGKSTLIHLLLGFLNPSSGRLRVLGTSDLSAARQRVGYVPERASYHTRFTARTYLQFLGMFGDLSGSVLRRRVEEQLKRVGLGEAADRALDSFSGGMLQRLGVAQALLHEPELLILDDPFSGLDIPEQRDVFDLLTELRAEGYSMLLCTPYTHLVARLCDRVGVLARGTLADETDTRRLRRTSQSVAIQVDQLSPGLRMQINNLSRHVECSEDSITISPNTQQLQGRVLQALLDSGVAILAIEPLAHPVEQFYRQAVERAEAAHENDSEQGRPFHMPPDEEQDNLLGTLLLGEREQRRRQSANKDE